MDALEPLETFWLPHPDYNLADEIAESKRLVDRQIALDRALKGEGDLFAALDMLAEHGLDVDEYLIATISNLDLILGN